MPALASLPPARLLDGSVLMDILISFQAVAGCAAMGIFVFLRLRDDARSAVLGERLIAQPAQPAQDVIARYLILTLMLRAAFYALVWAIGVLFRNQPLDPLKCLSNMLSRWDAPHYLDIARDGYTTLGEAGYNIVFFPLFPWLVRWAALITGDVFWASLLVNWLCSVASCYLLYRLAEPAMGRSAHRAVSWMLLFPTAFYLMAPYSEALFLMLSLGFFLALQRKRFLPAALLGGAAALTRNAGILLAVPYILGVLLEWCGARRPAPGCAPLDPRASGKMAARLTGTLLIACGTAVYLLVNQLVYGDPFMFLQIQRQNWQQGLGFFGETAVQIVRYAFFSETNQVVFLWVPQILVMAFSFFALLLGRSKMTSPQAAYSYAAFFFVLSATWLLSGARYMLVLFPVYIILARSLSSPRRRIARHLLGWLMAFAQLFLACGHALGQFVF